jgi:hypothetical protein
MPVLSLTSELCLLSLSIAEEVGFSAATPVEEGSTESLWAELPEELQVKVLAALPADWYRGCKNDSAAVRLVCSGWKAVHDAMVMKLLVRQKATDEGVGMLARRFPAVVSFELRWIFGGHAVTDVGVRAVSRLHALTFLDISYCDKLTDEALRAVIK